MTARRAILKCLWGPRGGQKHVLTPGARLRVGRLPPSDWELGHDAAMSAEHFEIQWDGSTGTVRDLGTAKGTFVGGETCAHEGHPLAMRSWIRAGETDFTFTIEDLGSRLPETHGPKPTDVLSTLDAHRRGGLLFGLVDASRDARVFELLETSIDRGRSLYEGYAGVALERSAPFLIQFDPSSTLLERLVDEGWTRGFATYFTSDDTERDLRRHFRRFLFVEAEGIEGRVYFRFYDPRVLRTFWPMATPRQQTELGAPVRRWFLPDDDGGLLDLPGAPSLSSDDDKPDEASSDDEVMR